MNHTLINEVPYNHATLKMNKHPCYAFWAVSPFTVMSTISENVTGAAIMGFVVMWWIHLESSCLIRNRIFRGGEKVHQGESSLIDNSQSWRGRPTNPLTLGIPFFFTTSNYRDYRDGQCTIRHWTTGWGIGNSNCLLCWWSDFPAYLDANFVMEIQDSLT